MVSSANKWIILFSFLALVGGFLLVVWLNRLPCRGNWRLPLKTGVEAGQFERQIEDKMVLLDTRACILSVAKDKDSLFPDSSSKITIGYFDRLGILHSYPARIGGSLPDGTNFKVAFCPSPFATCVHLDPAQVIQKLPLGKIANLEIVIKDTAPWEGSYQTKKYETIFDQLKNAIIAKKPFPSVSRLEDFVIQVWMIKLYEN